MLDNLKSDYIIKELFSLIDDKTKLNLIRHNKKLQNRLGISILDYKLFSGKSIIIGEDGKGKEYDKYNETIIYEGEYINGKRNGKGKEYNCAGKRI